jgi:hypothetical protein
LESIVTEETVISIITGTACDIRIDVIEEEIKLIVLDTALFNATKLLETKSNIFITLRLTETTETDTIFTIIFFVLFVATMTALIPLTTRDLLVCLTTIEAVIDETVMVFKKADNFVIVTEVMLEIAILLLICLTNETTVVEAIVIVFRKALEAFADVTVVDVMFTNLLAALEIRTAEAFVTVTNLPI